MTTLAPTQYWYLEETDVRPTHAQNDRRLYTLPPDVGMERCRSIVFLLRERFPCLRLTVERREGQWRYNINSAADEPLAFIATDLDGGVPDVQDRIEELATQIEEQMDVRCPLIRFVFIAAGGSNHLMIIANHLVVDYLSVKIIMHEFKELLLNDRRPAASCMFMAWLGELDRYVREEFEAEKEYWLGQPWNEVSRIPVTRREPGRDRGYWLVQRSQLSHEVSSAITTRARAWGVDSGDIVLAILADATFSLSGGHHMSISLWDHGRPSLRYGKSVGCFAYFWPLIVNKGSGTIRSMATNVLNTRTSATRKYGYILGRYGNVSDKARSAFLALNNPQVRINFRGKRNQGPTTPDDWWRSYSSVKTRVPYDTSRTPDMTVAVNVVDSVYRLDWDHSSVLYTPEDLLTVANAFEASAEKILIEP